MTERWLGVQVAGEAVTIVDAEIPDEGPVTIVLDETLKLQSGDRAKALCVMYERLRGYAQDKGIAKAIIKESALSLRGTKKAHLLAAELRGVAIAALGSKCPVIQASKANISRNFGERKADEYIADNSFWEDNILGEMRNGSREAALLILARRK
ncbi:MULTISPECIES: hypothetical protein [unclassified Shinella]|uniref:hypothetical protein n=1 Tax=unclassified Shinella TaxID=2643062 RepID=UPI00234E563F|nr:MULTISPECIES: hypothetical protein [unclassified Shinella]MCO5152543.1 hypothetical protein [Shinella sp.]MDC7261836.1 hypothetical protein [Shinella sp. HY16]MDC7268731.1 hypothetical protein [Shinella sp. YZ44]